MKKTVSMDFVRNGKTVSYEAEDILRLVRDDKPLADELTGQLVQVNAPRRVIDVIQQVPGGEVVDDSGTVTSAATLETQIIIAILTSAAYLGFKVGYAEGLEDAQEAEASGEGGGSGEGSGEEDGEEDGGDGSGGGQDAGDGEGERVGARAGRGGRS